MFATYMSLLTVDVDICSTYIPVSFQCHSLISSPPLSSHLLQSVSVNLFPSGLFPWHLWPISCPQIQTHYINVPRWVLISFGAVVAHIQMRRNWDACCVMLIINT